MSGTFAAVLLAATLAVPVPAPQAVHASADAVAQPHAVQHQQESQDRIDLNAANETQLQEVPGIGPAMASRIVTWREEHGPFERVEDLLNISGIGVKTLEKLRAYFVVAETANRRR
jgi:competence protein ComEA